MGSGTLTSARTSVPFRLAFGLVVFLGGVILFTTQHKSPASRNDGGPPPVTTVAGAVGWAEQLKGDLSGDGGPGKEAYLNAPNGMTMDSAGNLYVADTYNHRIRRIASGTGIISSYAGSGNIDNAKTAQLQNGGFGGDGGAPSTARLNRPFGLAVDPAGNVWIADTENHRVRRIDRASGVISTVAGTGQATFTGDDQAAVSSGLASPHGILVDADGTAYIADTGNHRIRKLDPATATISTLVGGGMQVSGREGQRGTDLSIRLPVGLALDHSGHLYFTEAESAKVSRLDLETGMVVRVAGDQPGFSGDGGAALEAQFNAPQGIAVDRDGNIYIADTLNHRIRRIDGVTGTVATIAGFGPSGDAPMRVQVGGDVSISEGQPTQVLFATPTGLLLASDEGSLLISDSTTHRLRRLMLKPSPLTAKTIAGVTRH